MAIDPSALYPGNIDTSDPNYPYGKPQNDSGGSPTGTPLDQAWLADLFGLQQALLSIAGITPSGTPDNAAVSQYLEALQKLNGRQVFDTAGAHTFNTPSWVKRIKVTVTGGGGGGANSTNSIGAVGGGGGGTSIAYIDDPAASYAVTVGAGGAGAAASTGDDGADGSNSVFGSITGGGGGGSGSVGWVGGGGGGGVGGLYTHYGHNGQGGLSEGSATRGGMGGASFFGKGGNGGRNNDQPGASGAGFGAGGGGGNGTGKGGDGTAGVVIVEWGIGI